MDKRSRFVVTASACIVSISALLFFGLGLGEALADDDDKVFNPALQAFQTSTVVTIETNEKLSQGVPVHVPPGKRLVIEYVSVFTQNEIRPFLGVAGVIETTLDGDATSVFHTACVAKPLNLNRTPGDPTQLPFSDSHAVCGDTVRLYADQVNVFARRPFAVVPVLPVQIRISGHLVDVR